MAKRLVCVALLLAVAAALPGRADAATVRQTIDTTGRTLSCGGQTIVFSGAYTMTARDDTRQVANGWRSNGVLTANFSAVTATNQSTGAVYNVVGVTSTTYSFAFGGLDTADVHTFVQTWKLIPVGGGTPLTFQEVLVHVFDSSGNEVVFRDLGPQGCD